MGRRTRVAPRGRSEPGRGTVSRDFSPAPTNRATAVIRELDYRTFLEGLPLVAADLSQLCDRGLSAQQIRHNGYR